MPGLKKILIFIPTFNEKENIQAMVERLLGLNIPGTEILIVDDNSPDGTARLVEALAENEPRLHLLRRPGPPGRGLAGREAYLYALRCGADALVEMDADFSHDPEQIRELLSALESGDVVVGSRLVPGGTDCDRPWFRRWLTLAANAFARSLMGLSVRDMNSGFRALTRKGIERVEPEKLRSRGPSILHEILFRAAKAGLKIREVPITFVDRKKGASKLNFRKLAAGYFWILRLAIFGV